ncbi:MAG: hypothetical protein WBR18_10600 [Anaerolineales bacterium]
MTEPIVFVIRHRIKRDKADEFRRHYQDSVPRILASKTGTLVQLAYENEVATEVTVVRVFPSADALNLQIQRAAARTKKTYTFIEPTNIEIFGIPNPAILEAMKKIAGSGLSIKISPNYIGGFIR